MTFGNLLTLAGGLGLFLFGMKQMSESIEKAAGAKLRKILEIFTTNKFAGLGVGMLFTAIVQSSSACTVMVVSFVNSGLINLYQAAGIIMGAASLAVSMGSLSSWKPAMKVSSASHPVMTGDRTLPKMVLPSFGMAWAKRTDVSG